ncbi:MAG: homoserine dehydrogenase [Ruminococcaceae bacterium]|nr:homoserine dehydrogenase [Oscillospiraceae bacterium]
MQTVNVAVMGHGVVGSGVVEVLLSHEKNIATKAKSNINVKYILDLRDFPGLDYSDRFIKDFDLILKDDSIKVVVEVMGGIHPAYDYVKACLEAGKSVCTSNKELVAAHGAELLKIAGEKNVNFLFEASVGGGIPVLRPIAQCLAANDLYEVFGILNGTTNFILTKMIRENMSFDDALALAQQLGYAERNPSADVDGHDACRKICILASLCFGKHVYPEQVRTEGITKITLADVEYADIAGYVIKLIGYSKLLDDGKITADVYPALVAKSNQLAGVDDVFNAVMVRGDAVGDVLFYGRGAGKLPTASAVVADVIDSVKHLEARKYLSWDDGDKDYVVDSKTVKTRLYVRAQVDDVIDAKANVFGVIDDAEFIVTYEDKDEVAFITPVGIESELKEKINSVKQLKNVSILHVLD